MFRKKLGEKAPEEPFYLLDEILGENPIPKDAHFESWQYAGSSSKRKKLTVLSSHPSINWSINGVLVNIKGSN